MKKLAVILSVSLFALCGCVDREFDIADVSGEVTIGGEELVLPLATLDKITIDNLLAENEIIKTDENGNYQIRYTSFGDDPQKYEEFSIGAIKIPAIKDLSPVIRPISFVAPELPTSLHLSPIRVEAPINYPSIGNVVEVTKINIVQEFSLGLPISGAGVLTDAMLAIKPELAKVNLTHNDEMHFEAVVTLPKEVKNIDFVEFGCDKHPFGAPVEISLDLNGVTNINGGGTLDLNINFPEGYYLRDESGADYPLATHNIVSKRISVERNQRFVNILTYLHKIDYGGRELTNGILEVQDDIGYNITLNLDVVAGEYDMSALPKFSFVSAPEYKDVEVVMRDFDVDPISQPICYTFNGLNSSIAIEKIAFTEAPLVLTLTGLEWLDVDAGIELRLPSCMNFDVVGNASKSLSEESVIKTSIRKMEQGVTIKLNHIDATDSATCKQENGQLVLRGEVVAKLDLSELNGHAIMLSRFIPKSESLNIGVNIAETNLVIDVANSVVKTVSSEAFDFNLEDQLPRLSHTVELPAEVASVQEVGIRNANDTTKPVAFTFKVAPNGGAFPVSRLDVDIAVNLGKMLRPTQATLDAGLVKLSENGDYLLVIDEEWDTSTALERRVEFEALQNLPKVVDGKMTIEQSFPVTGSVAIKSNENINLSNASNAVVKVEIAVDDIKLTTFKGGLDVGMSAEALTVDLSEISGLGVSVGAMSLNPVLKVNVADNPSGVPLYVEAVLRLLDSEGKQFSEIVTPSVFIVAEGATNIVLSTPKNEAIYKTEGVTFVGMEELASLLSSGIPSKIVADLNVKSNPNEPCEVELTSFENGVKIAYQYEVLLPLEFEGTLNLSYESQASGMNELFATMSSLTQGLTINDVAILTEFSTNIPFDIILNAELVNAQGTTEGIDAKLNIEECVIGGYTPEYGEQRTSNVVLNFDLGENKSLESLKNVDGIRFKFTICNTNQGVASLNKSQFLDGKLKLRLRDGVSIDIIELLKGQTEGE